MPLSEALWQRACPSLLNGTCPGNGGTHCRIPHAYEGGCDSGYCDGTRVGRCQVYCGEEIAVRKDMPEFEVYE